MDKIFDKMKQILLLSLSLSCLFGCKKSELMQYHAGNNIYFNYTYGVKTIAQYYEEIYVPFGKNMTTSSYDVLVDVAVLGNLEDRKRPFQMELNTTTSTAVEGVHFQLPPVDSFYIAPMKAVRPLTVKILRPAVLRDKVANIDLQLLSNVNFQAGMNITAVSGTGQRQAVSTLHIKVDDILLKPAIWDASVNSLGTWSREKLEKMYDAVFANLTLFYSETAPYTAGQLTTLSKNMQTYLNAQKNLGNTIREKDGSEMKMGPAAQ